ncbi:MAG: ASKHA domain-containing protein [Deltaproteobacteria bacterium]|nr:ASKHA domain-containing protein [Deltaproteobacteria bacterium]
MNKDRCNIRLISEDREISAEKGQNLLEALVGSGVLLRADCGGRGRCGKCKIRVVAPPQIGDGEMPDESGVLTREEIDAGYRLACRTEITGDMAVDIPESSLLAPEVAQKGPTALPDVIPVSRVSSWPYGIAVDLGTTTIALYLCDFNSGRVVASISLRNPQVMLGDDVMSRITAVSQNAGALKRLQKMAVQAMEWGAASLCRSTQTDPAGVGTMVIVGNSTMLHLFLGEDPTSIGVFPYDPLFKEERVVRAGDLGLRFNRDAEVRTLPLISGFLGADIVGAALATDMENKAEGTMLVDVGTNGELIFIGKDGFAATSCATGPAFEGASIRHGMHAISGAIDAVRVDRKTGRAECSVIQKNPRQPKKISGLCGSGVVSAVAELYRAGLILSDGRFNMENHPDLFQYEEELPEYILASGAETLSGRAVTLAQKDIRAIQLAKGALYAGIQMLCREKGYEQPGRLLIAGAFGSYIEKTDALAIGMFPALDPDAIEIVGNAAGAGAVLTLFDEGYRQKALELSQQTEVLELALHPDFQEIFIKSLAFP